MICYAVLLKNGGGSLVIGQVFVMTAGGDSLPIVCCGMQRGKEPVSELDFISKPKRREIVTSCSCQIK